MSKVLAAFMAIAAISICPAWADAISLHGSTTVINVIVAPHQADIEKLSGQQLDIVGNGSQRGIADLVSGKTQIAMISAPLETEIKKFEELQPGALGGRKLDAFDVGELRAAFVVHPSNPVKSLTDAQIADLLSGKIKNWSQVGGADQAVVIVAAQPGDGVRTSVEAMMLGGASLASDTRAMTNIAQVPKVVAQLPNALGLVALSGVDHSVIELQGISRVSLPLSLVVMGEPVPAVRQVIEAVARFGRSP
jgi:phosphate transport system substrate-binding protein